MAKKRKTKATMPTTKPLMSAAQMRQTMKSQKVR